MADAIDLNIEFASERYDRISWAMFDRKSQCNAYATSLCGQYIVGIGTESPYDDLHGRSKRIQEKHLLIVWNIKTGVQTCRYRYFFAFSVSSYDISNIITYYN